VSAGVHRRGSVHGPSVGVKHAQLHRAAGHRIAAIKMLADDDLHASATAPARLRRDLQDLLAQPHGVISSDDTRLLMAQDGVEIDRAERDERAGGIARWPRKRRIVARQERLDQVRIGCGQRGDAGDAELIDEPILERPIEALTAATGLRGVRGNVLDAESLERTADLRQSALINRPLRGRRVKRPLGSV